MFSQKITEKAVNELLEKNELTDEQRLKTKEAFEAAGVLEEKLTSLTEGMPEDSTAKKEARSCLEDLYALLTITVAEWINQSGGDMTPAMSVLQTIRQ